MLQGWGLEGWGLGLPDLLISTSLQLKSTLKITSISANLGLRWMIALPTWQRQPSQWRSIRSSTATQLHQATHASKSHSLPWEAMCNVPSWQGWRSCTSSSMPPLTILVIKGFSGKHCCKMIFFLPQGGSMLYYVQRRELLPAVVGGGRLACRRVGPHYPYQGGMDHPGQPLVGLKAAQTTQRYASLSLTSYGSRLASSDLHRVFWSTRRPARDACCCFLWSIWSYEVAPDREFCWLTVAQRLREIASGILLREAAHLAHLSPHKGPFPRIAVQ